MRLVCISDTHTLQKEAFGELYPKNLPEGDILLCAGDITNIGEIFDVNKFLDYFKNTNFKHKICIAGNHDFCFSYSKLLCKELLTSSGWNYLEDQEIVIDGVKFYGSPWQPEFCNWAFNLPRGERLARVWDNIPLDTDVLITHGPPYGILDKTERTQENVGCEELIKKVLEVKPMLHLFGHIHEAYGILKQDDIIFCNASICTLKYNPINKPFVFDFDVITGMLNQVI